MQESTYKRLHENDIFDMFTVIYHSLILSVSLRLLGVFFFFFNNAKIDGLSDQHVSWDRWSFIYKFRFVWVFLLFLLRCHKTI